MINRILYIAFKHDCGIKENGLAINYKAWFENFAKLGYEIEGLFFEDFSFEELQLNIIAKAKEINPDLIFFILQKDQIAVSTLKELQDLKFFTTCFFGDDQWRFDGWSSRYAPYFNACITTDKFSIDKYRLVGQEHVVYSQWASLDSCIEYKDNSYKYNVSFVGGANAYRKWFVNELKKRDINVECFGNGWSNGRVTYEQMEEIFSVSKINLNISNSISYDLRFLLSSFRSFLSILKSMIKGNSKNSSQTKARNFEIPAQGGFQITDYVPTLEEYYDIGKEVVCYSSIDEAEKLVKYFLKHENERENIKIAGVKKARENHTYKNRIVDFMKVIKKIHDNKK